jgi:hypothetical protein
VFLLSVRPQVQLIQKLFLSLLRITHLKKTFKQKKRSRKMIKGFQCLGKEKSQRSWKAASPKIMERWTLTSNPEILLVNKL